MAIRQRQKSGHRCEGAHGDQMPAWFQPLPTGPVRFDPALRTARQLLEEASGDARASADPDTTAGASRRAA